MRSADLQPGDCVEVNIRGRQGAARVTGRPADDGRWPIQPLNKGIAGYFSVTNRQIKGVLSRAKGQLQIGAES